MIEFFASEESPVADRHLPEVGTTAAEVRWMGAASPAFYAKQRGSDKIASAGILLRLVTTDAWR